MPKQSKWTFDFGIIPIELKNDIDLKYIITNEIPNVPIDPTAAKHFIQGQRSYK